MKGKLLILTSTVFVAITADYVGPRNGFSRYTNGNGNGKGNGNGNAYGVPSAEGPSGPYPPSGWKPAGRRLLLPGEGRGAEQPLDSGYGQPPPPEYGPSIDNTFPPNNQYIPGTLPPNNQYIPSTGFGNGNGNGNGNGFTNGNGNGFSTGNGHNGNGNGFPTGNGHNGNGHNGNGNSHNGNGNGHNGNGNKLNGNGNGHNGNGNGFSTGNGHNGNGNGHNGNGNKLNGNGFNGNGLNGNGNGHNGNGNGFSNGNGHNGGNGNGNGNGHSGNGNGFNGNSNGFANGIGGNGNGNNGKGVSGTNGNGKNGNGATGHIPSFQGSFPGGGVIYPFVQLSVPATIAAVRPGNGASNGIYPVFHVPHSQVGTGGVVPSFPTNFGSGGSFFSVAGGSDLGSVYPSVQVTDSQNVATSYPAVLTSGHGLVGNGIGQYYTLLSNGHSHKSHIFGLKNGLNDLQAQYSISQPIFSNGGVPLGVF